MAYFNYFPLIPYDVRGTKEVNIQFITNILVRARKKLEVTNVSLFSQYFILDTDRPDTLAHQIYGDSELHWIILYANYMTNPYYDWPLTSFDLNNFITEKYKDSGGMYGVHHHEDTDGYEIDALTFDKGTMTWGATPNATPVTNFSYEEKKNDNKRKINVIKNEYISQIISEFKNIVG
jgi:hypothetical protein